MRMVPIVAWRRPPTGKTVAALCAIAVSLAAVTAAPPARADDDGLVGQEGDFVFTGNLGAAGTANLHSHAKITGFADGVLTMHYENRAVSLSGHEIMNISSDVVVTLSKVKIEKSDHSGETQFSFVCLNNTPCINIAFNHYYNELRPIDQVQNPELQSNAFFETSPAAVIYAKLCTISQC